MPALTFGDEKPSLAWVHVTEPQPEHLAATQPAEQHGLHHGPVPVRAQGGHERVDLVRGQDPRQRPRPADQRHTGLSPITGPARGHPPRHRVTRHPAIPASHQVVEQAADAGQPPGDGPSRQSRFAVLQPHNPLTQTRFTLRLDKDENIGRRHIRRILRHDREEHLQIERRRQPRVRATAGTDKLQIVVDHRMTQPQGRNLRSPIDTDQARTPRHRVFLSTVGRILHRTPDNGQDHPHIRHDRSRPPRSTHGVSGDYMNTMMRKALDIAFTAAEQEDPR